MRIRPVLSGFSLSTELNIFYNIEPLTSRRRFLFASACVQLNFALVYRIYDKAHEEPTICVIQKRRTVIAIQQIIIAALTITAFTVNIRTH